MQTQFSCRERTLISKFTSTPIKTHRKVFHHPQQLIQVQSPSTSYSPFRKKEQTDSRLPLRSQVNQILAPKSPSHYCCNYYQRPKENNQDLLDETINKLNFLERRIAAIMEKNDHLRSHLKRTEQDTTFEQFSYYLTQPPTCKQQPDSSAKMTIQTNASPEQSLISHRENALKSNPKTPSVGRFKKSSSQVREIIINGRGKKIYENNFKYEGDFLNSLREGNGTLTNQKGEIVYQGQWKNDQFSGRGKFTSQDWINDELHLEFFKEFKHVQHQFVHYEGEFKDGQFHGQGSMIFRGEGKEWVYKGGFALDAFHGTGSIFEGATELMKGKWIYGGFV